jgi:hypothetical protein
MSDKDRAPCIARPTQPGHCRHAIWLQAVLGFGWAYVLLTGSGCHSGAPRLAASPLSVAEQQAAILKIAPLGTPREELLERLKEAGIQATPGSSPSIYYCDVWNREDGQRWHLDVALLFDGSGQLYLTRPAQAEIGLESDGPSSKPREAQTAIAGRREAGSAIAPAQEAARGSRPRTPFSEESP